MHSAVGGASFHCSVPVKNQVKWAPRHLTKPTDKQTGRRLDSPVPSASFPKEYGRVAFTPLVALCMCSMTWPLFLSPSSWTLSQCGNSFKWISSYLTVDKRNAQLPPANALSNGSSHLLARPSWYWCCFTYVTASFTRSPPAKTRPLQADKRRGEASRHCRKTVVALSLCFRLMCETSSQT